MMKRINLILLVSMMLSLACGVMATMPTLPTVTDTPANTPTQPQEAPSATETHAPTPTATPARLRVYGTWNVRELPCVDCPLVRYQVDGYVTFLGWAQNGFIQIGEREYICARAVLMNVECE